MPYFFASLVGLILLIFLLSLIMGALERYQREDNREPPDPSCPTDDQTNEANYQALIGAIADAIHTYTRYRQSDERRRAYREQVTIVVLGFAAIFALAAAAAAIYSAIIFTEQAIDFRDQERRQLRGYLGVTEFRFSCGDCLPTEDDQLETVINNFGQTPLTMIGGVIWPTEYLISEIFPEKVSRQNVTARANMVPRDVIIYPKIGNKAQFSSNEIDRMLFWEAKNGDYWIMLRGVFRYRDIFEEQWDNFWCFVYNPTVYKHEPTGAVHCPKYEEEKAASDKPLPEEPPPTLLPNVPKNQL